MKHFKSLLTTCLALGLVGSVHAAADCSYDDTAKQSWKALFQRQLKVLDPAHAEKMSRLAADIIDGNSSSLANDMNGVDVNTPFKLHGREMSMLDLAASACQLPIVKQLVVAGAHVDGSPMSTPIVSAAGHGREDIVEFLLNQGARIDKVDANGHTALEEAVRQRALPATKVLLAHGDNVNRPIGGNANLLDLVAAGNDSDSKAVADELRKHAARSSAVSSPTQ